MENKKPYKDINTKVNVDLWNDAETKFKETSLMFSCTQSSLITIALQFYINHVDKFKAIREKEMNNE